MQRRRLRQPGPGPTPLRPNPAERLTVRKRRSRKRIVTAHKAHTANAGHVPPLLRHPDGRTETVDLPPGLLLGIDSDHAYRPHKLSLMDPADLDRTTEGLLRHAHASGPRYDDIALLLIRSDA
ncbi:SpoIIE family protein phosphatase [Streptomyces sp. NPDC005012]|uniref:SpoIIE family protein phosphatase n=1 Tax=unclassified Streptomyces TaxID=2593676 RepID=UPI0033A5FD86